MNNQSSPDWHGVVGDPSDHIGLIGNKQLPMTIGKLRKDELALSPAGPESGRLTGASCAEGSCGEPAP